VVPIGAIVAVAIVCIVVAVLSSARRADQVAIQHEAQLLARALDSDGERVLREVESVASSQSAIENIRLNYDSAWVARRVGVWLQSFFEHDYVIVLDGEDQPLYAIAGDQAMSAAALAAIKPQLAPLIDYMRGRALSLDGGLRVGQATPTEGGAHPQAAVITRLLNLPAVIAAAAVGPVNGVPPSLDNRAPIILSVKFIKRGLLADIGTQLRMTDLRPLVGKVPRGDTAFTLADARGYAIARFAWSP
jgi:sensor domain CHASE-containing protein